MLTGKQPFFDEEDIGKNLGDRYFTDEDGQKDINKINPYYEEEFKKC